MKAPFNVRAGPPIDHLSGIPGPGQYEAKPVDESQCDYASVFNSRTKRSLYGKFPPYPAPDRYSEIKDWTPAPPPEPRPNYEPEPYRPPSGFFGQPNIAGYAENESGRMVPIIRMERGPEMIGPGTYSPKQPENDIPSVSLGMEARQDLWGTPPDVPGPGAYLIPEINTKIPVAISKRVEERPSSSVRKIHCGPKAWTSLAAETNAVFKFQGDRQIFPPGDQTPDPGYYNPESARRKEAGDRSSFSVRSDRPEIFPTIETPGPGTYEIKDKWIKDKRPTTPRAVVEDVIPTAYVPGPGAYNVELKRKIDRRPNSVFMSRSKRTTSAETDPPGPGKYSPKIIDEYRRIPKKITQTRYEKVGDWLEQSKKKTPSPDAYQRIDSDLRRGRTIPKSPRFAVEHRNRVPGPGTYEVKHATMFRKSRNSSVPPMPDD